jgi:hypothetical protein
VNQEVLKAIKNNWLFMFHPGQLYHMKEPMVNGIKSRGWGISRCLIDFRQIYYVQTLRRYNEAIALDYVIPFRLITPMPRSGSATPEGGDIMMNQDMGSFMGQVRRMLRRRRRDPAGWNTLPFPVQYQALGGDARQLAPSDLLQMGYDNLLNDLGVPVDMYKGTMQMQAAPVAIRLFEATWHPLVHDCNFFLQWMLDRISEILSWETGKARLKRPTHADDINRQMAMLQLMVGQTVSQGTALRGFGIDWFDEQKRISEEARYSQEMQARIQEEMEQAGYAQEVAKGMPAQAAPGGGPAAPPGAAVPPGGGGAAGSGGAGAPAGGGMPGSGGGAGGGIATGVTTTPNTPTTPEDIMAEADSVAQQLLGMPESVKDSELRALKEKNPVLHMAVRQRMDEIRQQAQTAGGAAMLQQQYGQQ